MELEWQYSRNRGRHWVDDGERYGSKKSCLFEIKSCTPWGFMRKRGDGHDLLFKGKKIGHSKSVADLKDVARGWIVVQNSMRSIHESKNSK